MKRREFIAGLAGAAAWPLAVRAQQPALPVIGYLNDGTLETRREQLANLHRGLAETGYVEGRNLGVEYRWAEGHYDRLPALASDLVRHQVALIVAHGSTAAALAAKAATQTIPIVFSMGSDPVEIGLITSLNRPGGNLTGISLLNAEVVAKRLEGLAPAIAWVATWQALIILTSCCAISLRHSTEATRAASTSGVARRRCGPLWRRLSSGQPERQAACRG